MKGAGLGRRLVGLSLDDKRLLLDLFTKSAADFLGQWFESDVVKGALAFDGIVGAYASPYTPGTAYLLLHYAFGEVNGKPGVWGHAIGGMGAITQAMARAAEARGAVIRTGAPVASLIVERRPRRWACSWSRASECRRAPSPPTCRPSCCFAIWFRMVRSIPNCADASPA